MSNTVTKKTGWRLVVNETSGRAVITLRDDGEIVGTINLALERYQSLCGFLMHSFATVTGRSLRRFLKDWIWQSAQRHFREDADEAMRRLVEFGWSSDTIDRLARETTLELSGEMLGSLQEHVS